MSLLELCRKPEAMLCIGQPDDLVGWLLLWNVRRPMWEPGDELDWNLIAGTMDAAEQIKLPHESLVSLPAAVILHQPCGGHVGRQKVLWKEQG